MPFDIVPEHLPVISAQLGITFADTMQVLAAAAAACVALPPAIDDVSALYPVATFSYGERFFGYTTPGMGYHADASAVLPEVAAAYSGSDIIGGANVFTSGSAFVE